MGRPNDSAAPLGHAPTPSIVDENRPSETGEQPRSREDINLQMTFNIEEDLSAELEEFARLARLQLRDQADLMLQEVLLRHSSWFPVFAECAEYLLGSPLQRQKLLELLEASRGAELTNDEANFKDLVVRLSSDQREVYGLAIKLLDRRAEFWLPEDPVAIQTIETILVHSGQLVPMQDCHRLAQHYFDDALRAGEWWFACRVLPFAAEGSAEIRINYLALREASKEVENRDMADLAQCTAELYSLAKEPAFGLQKASLIPQTGPVYESLLRTREKLQHLLNGNSVGGLFLRWTECVQLVLNSIRNSIGRMAPKGLEYI